MRGYPHWCATCQRWWTHKRCTSPDDERKVHQECVECELGYNQGNYAEYEDDFEKFVRKTREAAGL